MTGPFGDDHGQWLLLSGVIIAVGLVVLLLLLNTAMMTGHSSTDSVMSFPKNDLRDLSAESKQEARLLAIHMNHDVNLTSGQAKKDAFITSYDKFTADMEKAYAARGAYVDIQYKPNATDKLIDFVIINVSYDNGNTLYKDSLWTDFI